MKPQHRTRLLVETLEDRLTPAGLSFFYDGSNLRITGLTTSPTFTITETANNTLTAGSFGPVSVTGNLTVTLIEAVPANSLTISYNLGAFRANGAVSLSGTAIGPASTTTVSVTGTAATIGGPLTISVLNPHNDLVTIDGLTVGGISVNDVAGNGTVNIAQSANVTDNGNLFIANANTVRIDAVQVPAAAGTATIQGLVNISTRNIGVPNMVNIGTNSLIQGALIFTGAGNNTVNLGGTVLQQLVAQLGNGANTLTLSGIVLGTSTVVGGNGGNTVTAAAGSLFLGNVSMVLGNSPNVVDFNGTALGTVSYFGGNGGDSFTFDTAASAQTLNLFFGNGNDTFTLNTDNVNRIFANGGFGTNTFVMGPGVVRKSTFILINFS
jgi:hypothetical protein